MLKVEMTRQEIEQAGLSEATKQDEAVILGSFKLKVDKSDLSIGRWLSETGFWESWITSWMTRNINPGDVCLDLGANFGYYTRIMQYFSGKKGLVYAVESNGELVEKISNSLYEFPIVNTASVVLLPVAAWNNNSIVSLNIQRNMIGGSFVSSEKVSLSSDEERYSTYVPAVRLDDCISREIDFLKMDIEGSEPIAFEGMTRILKNLRVGIIEINRNTPANFLKTLEKDYQLSLIDFNGHEEDFSSNAKLEGQDVRMMVIRRKTKQNAQL